MQEINKKNRKAVKSAFSLIEISIVLLIIGIVVSGMLTISTVAVTNERIRVTKERMDAIYKALGQYMLKNYRLPCPSSITALKNSSSYGVATSTDGNCNISQGIYVSATMPATPFYGAVPANTLGLTDEYAEDGFGNKFGYIMYRYYNVAEFPAVTDNNGFSFNGADPSMPDLISMPSGNINLDNAFILISHGPNRYGAFPANSSAQNSTAGASTYEISNALANRNGNVADFGAIASRPNVMTFVISDSDSTVFDDIVIGKTRAAMMLDFDAMFLSPCVGDGSYPSAYFGKTVYRNTSCPFPNSDIVPSKKCINFRTWINVQNCP